MDPFIYLQTCLEYNLYSFAPFQDLFFIKLEIEMNILAEYLHANL